MAALTRYGGWGMPSGLPSTPQWQLAVLVVYTVAVWSTIMLIGALSTGTTPLRGAAAAALGAIAGYAVLALCLKVVPSYGQTKWNPASLIPSPVNLMDGLLSGAGVCLALSLDSKFRRKPA
ncbi:MAG: hypothetical protein M0D55_10855 [Elusimicrobiota bacterium]|nr:MAG: hypothetical protein M0D55_10855 [Elusimicrobiota bacterium]